MKKIALIILVFGFAVGAKAQNSVEGTGEPVVEIENDCIQEETEDHYEAKKKRKNRMAAYATIDPMAKSTGSNNPYNFASKEVVAEESDSKIKTALKNIKTFFRRKDAQ
jgi:hypothetical protein